MPSDNGPEVLYQRYQRLQRLVGWTDADGERVREAARVVQADWDQLVEDFSTAFQQEPEARKVITGGEAQLSRLKQALRCWLEELFSGQYDGQYVRRRWEMGRRHVELGLDWVYLNVSLSRLRAGLVRAIHQRLGGKADERNQTARSLHQLLDLELALLASVYQTEYRRRQQQAERLGATRPLAGGVVHELRDREARLSSILKTAVDGIITIDERGIVQSMNPAAERMFGYESREVVGRSVTMLMPVPDREEHDHYLATYLRTGKKKVIGMGREVAGLRKDGSVFPMDIAVSEVELADRRLFTGFVRDITERKRAEAELRLLHTAIGDLEEGVVITDAQLARPGPKILFVNAAMTKITGYTADELVGQTPRKLQGEKTDRRELDRMKQLLAAGKSYFGHNINYRKDGSQYDVELQISPVFDDAGHVVHYVSTHRDITERKRAQEAIRQQRDFAESVIETAQAIVLILDAAGRIVRFNPFMEQLSGYAQAEVRGKDWFETFVPEQERPRVRGVFHQALDDVPICGAVHCLLTKKGAERQIQWWSKTLKDGEGRVTGVLSVGHDITGLKDAERQLVQQERLAAVGQTVAGLAHESRNAFQRSQACLEMLALELEGRSEELELVERIQRSLDHLYQLYEEVRIYAAPIQLDYQPCDLAHVWRDAWSHLEAMRREKHVQLIEETQNIDLSCEADWFAMGRVFRNLLENAISACPDPGKIVIRCCETALGQSPALEVSVRDNGPGFDPGAKDKAFDAFFTTKTKGTGLGMAIAKRIVEAHGGRLAIGQSRDGAEILITLPRSERGAQE